MSKNRKWVKKDEMHLMRSTNGGVWFCKKCQHIMPYDEALDGEQVVKDKPHKYPRHHHVYAVFVPNVVAIGDAGMYYLDGTVVKSEAEIIKEYREKLVEHIELPDTDWYAFTEFAEKYKNENRSITYNECVKCFRVSECSNILNPPRVFHCDILTKVLNRNIKQWYDTVVKQMEIEAEKESNDPFKSLRSK